MVGAAAAQTENSCLGKRMTRAHIVSATSVKHPAHTSAWISGSVIPPALLGKRHALPTEGNINAILAQAGKQVLRALPQIRILKTGTPFFPYGITARVTVALSARADQAQATENRASANTVRAIYKVMLAAQNTKDTARSALSSVPSSQ
ncbi:hypothetical protein N879_06205 [Alcaligenes sp. EGD-AK7]|nr:hypothetical protein N879_06205 [Alcaligenes sp. EGD-AK7]